METLNLTNKEALLVLYALESRIDKVKVLSSYFDPTNDGKQINAYEKELNELIQLKERVISFTWGL